VYDHFFESGGDSLRARELVVAITREIGWEISLEVLLARPTVAQMAEAIETGIANPSRQRWMRPWKASLVAMRPGKGTPLVFIPGGYTGENELLVFASLLPCLRTEHPVLGARFNFMGSGVLPPLSLKGIARKLSRAIHRSSTTQTPILIGECQSCGLTLETARLLHRTFGSTPKVILLDPWLPRTKTSSNHRNHPRAIAWYLQLARRYEPRTYNGEVHLICAEGQERLSACLDWWNDRLKAGCHGHLAPGDHYSYLRSHREPLADILNGILQSLSRNIQPHSL
jgi:hypothetical protein